MGRISRIESSFDIGTPNALEWKYYIVRLALGHSDKVELCHDEFRQAASDRAICRHAIVMEEKFDLFLRNFMDFERTLLDIALRQMLGRDLVDYAIRENLVRLNQYASNLLASGRLYVDQSKIHYQEIARAANLDLQALCRFRQAEYDRSSAFRVGEALRNYAQHQEFPIHRVAFGSAKVGQLGAESIRYCVTPYVDPAKLEADTRFKKSVLRELLQGGKALDAKLLFREYAASFSLIHYEYRRLIDEPLRDARRRLVSLIERFPGENSDLSRKSVGLTIIKEEKPFSRQSTNDVPLTLAPLEYHDVLKRQNSNLSGLELRYVSSGIESQNNKS